MRKRHGPYELALISGKGGTGKTSFTGSFAALKKRAVVADCDVDAANLALILRPMRGEPNVFSASKIPKFHEHACTGCGLCVKHCRAGALKIDGGRAMVDASSCESSLVCYNVCPEGSISLEDRISGEWYVSNTPYGTLVHARLRPGEEKSGKLVTLLRTQATDCWLTRFRMGAYRRATWHWVPCDLVAGGCGLCAHHY